jgi:Cu+-exporting ATPase
MAKERLKCVHCGEDCGKYPVFLDDKPYCCNGCKTVYQIVNQNKLYTYYELEETPGVRLENPEFGDKFAYLDQDEIKDQLLEFKDGDFSKATFFIPTIHCSSCIWLLENLNALNPGISYSSVNFVKKEVSVTFKESKISMRQVVELMASVHYAPIISLEDLDKGDSQKTNRSLIYKLGVAGFSFGNIMMLSLPDYLARTSEVNPALQRFLSFLILILAVPVLVYSASDYLLSAYKNLKVRMVNTDMPISLGILALFGQSVFEILSNTGTGYFDSFAGFVFFLLIGKWYQGKTYQALSFERDYKSYFPIAITKIFEGKEDIIQIRNLQEGDRILVRHNELIPVDSELVKGMARIDYSFVTGESNPVSKLNGDPIYAGGKQVGAAIELKVNKSVDQSNLTKLWNQSESNDLHAKTLNTIVDRVSKWFTYVVIAIALSTAAVWFFIEPYRAISILTAVLIVACPCALALSIPFTYGNSMRIFGKQGFYIKQTQVIENLAKVDTVVFDKTGTITESNAVEVVFVGEKELGEEEKSLIRSLARQSTHPLSTALYNHFDAVETHYVSDFDEVPSGGVEGKIGEHILKLGSEAFVCGDRVIQNFLQSQVFVSIDGACRGYFRLENKYREGLSSLIDELGKHYELHLLSGDNEGEKERLLPLFKEENRLHFNQKPEDKLAYIQKLREDNKNVLMIGDGLNDAGALNSAQVGITIADNIYNFSPACDGILEAKRFKHLGGYLKMARASINTVKASFGISILYNTIGLGFAIQGLLTPIVAAILMPISSVTVVLFVSGLTALLGLKYFSKLEEN